MAEESKLSNESGLENLKQDYEVLREKYGFSDFEEMNRLFEIEELSDCETEFLIRKIRKVISERISGHLRFVEILLNPSNAPIFFFKMIKKLDNSDKEVLTRICDELGNFEIEVVKLDLEYSEEKEAEFVKKMFDRFVKIKKELLIIVDKLSNGKGKSEPDRSSYFG